jgi:gamma-glutamyltranspeptidase/glutathione hydrolase
MPRVLRLIVLLALLAAPSSAAAAVPRPTPVPTATGVGGSAASVDPYATKAAIDVLRKGGNAIDAAVAAAGVLGVVEPYSSGIGGGGFMVIRDRRGRIRTIDGREFAPAAYRPDIFIDPATGKPIPFDERVTSGLGVGVPGTLRTWEKALRAYGTRKLSKLLKPAIRIARDGFEVDPTFTQQTKDNQARFADFTSTAALYLPGGQPPAPGTTFTNPDLAKTMQTIARKGVEAFYQGAIAADIVDTIRQPPVRPGATRNIRPGVMSADDLVDYVAKWRKPTRIGYRGLHVWGMGPPSSGGTTVGEALNIMESKGGPAQDPVEELHRYLESSKLAYADRAAYLGDPDFVDVPVRCLLSQPFADGRGALIGQSALPTPQKAGTCPAEASASGAQEGPSTTHLTVADKKGNVVAYTFTIEQTGGSGIVVPGRGFLLNNELTDFEPTTGLPNSPAARKRPRSSISPTIVTRFGKRNKPVLAVGSPGGATIITTVLQILVDRFERGMSLPAAIADPRTSNRNGAKSDAEPAFLASPLAAGLQARGHQFAQVAEIGAATGIEFRSRGRQQAAAEPVRRGGGSAMVVRKP